MNIPILLIVFLLAIILTIIFIALKVLWRRLDIWSRSMNYKQKYEPTELVKRRLCGFRFNCVNVDKPPFCDPFSGKECKYFKEKKE